MPLLRSLPCVLFLLASAASAQPEQTVLFPGQVGDELRASLVDEYKPATVLSSAASKDRMVDSVWNVEVDGTEGVVGVYTGYFVAFDCNPTCDPNQDVYNGGSGLDQEHMWPRSQGAEGHNGERDLHHLAPTWTRANSDRGNLPFGEVPDPQTDDWYFENTVTSSIPSSNIDAYSERDRNVAFEPREGFKGEVARAMFYFYTMYEQASDAFFEEQKETLYAWHYLDPVDEPEYGRTFAIAGFQEDKPNPFVLDSTLIRRAFFPPPPVANEADPLAGGFALSAAYPNPFTTATTFSLRVDASQTVRVEAFDLLGRRVAVLHDGPVPADAPLRLTLDAAGLPAGLYVYRASGETFQATRRVTLAR